MFVTIDDGIEKDPKLIQMVKDFQVPITICLADVLIRDDYAYFESRSPQHDRRRAAAARYRWLNGGE